MKTYPSIHPSTGQKFLEMLQAYVFDKYDGSNLRWEWNRKQGRGSGKWNKFGSRTVLFDASHPIFGCAVPVFMDVLAEPIERWAVDNRHENITAFTEFWGANSFAGNHDPNDDFKTLTLFDINVYKKGMLSPAEFLKDFGGTYFAANFRGRYNWTREFVQRVRDGSFDCTFEGVVGKVGSGHNITMCKAKTQAWIDKVRAVCDNPDDIINS
jgi:hypothetical protein